MNKYVNLGLITIAVGAVTVAAVKQVKNIRDYRRKIDAFNAHNNAKETMISKN